MQLGADEFQHGEAAEQVDRWIALGFRAGQDGLMNRDQDRLQIGGTALAQICVCCFGRTDEFSLRPAWDFHVEERLDFAEAADVLREMEAQVRGETRAEENVVAKIVDPQLEVAKRQRGLVAPEIGRRRRFRGS